MLLRQCVILFSLREVISFLPFDSDAECDFPLLIAVGMLYQWDTEVNSVWFSLPNLQSCCPGTGLVLQSQPQAIPWIFRYHLS